MTLPMPVHAAPVTTHGVETVTSPDEDPFTKLRGYCSTNTNTNLDRLPPDGQQTLLRDHEVQRLMWVTGRAKEEVQWREDVVNAANSYVQSYEPQYDPSPYYHQRAVVNPDGLEVVGPYENRGHLVAPYTRQTVDYYGETQYVASTVHYLTDRGRTQMNSRQAAMEAAGITGSYQEREEVDAAQANRNATSERRLRAVRGEFANAATELDTRVRGVIRAYFSSERSASIAQMRGKGNSKPDRGGGEGPSRGHHRHDTTKSAGKSRHS